MGELLLGAGHRRVKHIETPAGSKWSQLTTLDINPACKPDVVHDLGVLPYPFADNSFDEIHAYEVMEHVGRQGDYKFFFAQWEELWRILKPEGLFCGTSPARHSPWVWGDPGHTRAISPECLTFLSQAEYAKQVGANAISDYRWVYKADFEFAHFDGANGSGTFVYVLRAKKHPSPGHVGMVQDEGPCAPPPT